MTNRKRRTLKRNYFTNIVFMMFLIIVFFSYTRAESWRWIAYGDTRNCPPRREHAQVLQSMIANTPDYKFIINIGDVVDHGDIQSEWDAWFQETSGILGGLGQDQAPPRYMSTPGNHDATETVAGLTNWNTYLSGQVQQFGNGGKFFTFDYENARFIIMDSDKSSKTGAQLTMMMEAIENNPKTWLFVITHRPIFDFGEYSYNDVIHDTWGITLYEHGCDMIFNGHAHYYVRSKKLKLNGDSHPPLDPEKGIVQVVTGNGGAPIDIPDPNHDGNGYLVAANSTNNTHYGYTELTVGLDTLFLRHYLRDGTILDEEVYTPNPKTGTAINEIRKIMNQTPSEYQLLQNYPNPFNPITTIQFSLPVDGSVVLNIYDISGRKVSSLINGFKTAGNYTIQWNCNEINGMIVPSGVYFGMMKADSFVKTIKIIVLK